MLWFVWLLPALPLAGYLVLGGFGRGFPPRVVAAIGAGTVGLALLVAIGIGAQFMAAPPAGHGYTQVLWTWMKVRTFAPQVALYLDPLSVVMALVVTFVGFWIHLYSVEFMAGDEGYSRFFAYMNLFVASMLILVLADNLLLLFLGWEGVGLCSYLIIGFWYQDPENGAAARKAFIVTRVGDVAFTVGLLLLLTHLGTSHIQTLMGLAAARWPVGSAIATATAVLLVGGAAGKSAQLPRQTWLPDAMAGPTPTSALIHAATMVTAGVYLIARTRVLFELAPAAMTLVAVIGAATLVLASFSALVQTNIKRVLAYSTVAQIGYMFLALGVGAWPAAIFHLMTHAFFKALLFMAAGVVINCLHHEHDLRKMGGLRRDLPVAFWSFVIGGAALVGFPLVTAGFYSKGLILWEAYASPRGNGLLWAAGLLGTFLTALYISRLIFLVFFGERQQAPSARPGIALRLSLVVLAVFSVIGGWINIPRTLGNLPLFERFLAPALPAAVTHGTVGFEGARGGGRAAQGGGRDPAPRAGRRRRRCGRARDGARATGEAQRGPEAARPEARGREAPAHRGG
jgi:NADH-quinone oxidoreductase subunit L